MKKQKETKRVCGKLICKDKIIRNGKCKYHLKLDKELNEEYESTRRRI